MNAVEIEEAISQLADQPFDPVNFPYAFLEAFGNKETTIKRLRAGASNKSDLGGVLQTSNIHIKVCAEGEVTKTLAALRESPSTTRGKAKFILATDGQTLEAENLASDDPPVACNYTDFPDHFGFFLPLAGISTVRQITENSFDIRATSRLNRLYVELLKDNPEWGTSARRHDMNHFMARLIFCFFAEDIRVFQDTRGKFKSEGDYVMPTLPTGPLNPDGPNDTTDAWDTVDWLSKNVPESNGKVGMVGISYEGYTVVMALLHPHPALKVAVPENPMVDGWMGDDWFHYGAFRQKNFDFFLEQTAAKGGGPAIPRLNRDDYTNFLELGSAGNFARYGGLGQLPFWRKIEENPSYDAFWRDQALDRFIAKVPLTVPTMWVQGLWDQEDMYGAIHCYEVEEPKDTHNDMNYLVMGPWSHGEEGGDAYNLGPLVWNGDTGEQFRSEMMLPFLNQYLKDGAPKANTPAVVVYNTGENHWEHFSHWPLSCEKGCADQSKPLYLQADGKLSFTAPEGSAAKYDEYVSDPAKPVPFSPRPYYEDSDAWRTWLVHDQRFVDGRPDVLSWETAPLTKPLRLSGPLEVHLYASTSGTDSDWAVKLIDVYPGQYPPDPSMGGYELPISTDIFRGRYRTSFEHPEPITPNKPLLYQFAIPMVNHVFEPGHRIMVQVQSTLFPAYDRNPQTFVPNIFNAKPSDYQKATQRIWHTPGDASFISLPVVPMK